ncbi:MAG: hypothetical protein NUV67_06095 [archaeon]|nr:hypothetical protein [archaeon]
MLENNLGKIGFSPSEIKVYLNLLQRSNSYANKISVETGVNRTNVYEALDRLCAKGVVSFITRNKVKWYEAMPAESLTSVLGAKEAELQKTGESLLTDLKKLKKALSPPKEPLEAGIFVGKKGFRMLFDEMLEARKPIHFFAAELQFKSLFGVYFEQWHKKRIEKGIMQKTIFPKKMKAQVKQRKLLKYKFVDDEFANPTTTIIYGNATLLINWGKEPIVIKIENREIAKSHLNYFNLIWKSA